MYDSEDKVKLGELKRYKRRLDQGKSTADQENITLISLAG